MIENIVIIIPAYKPNESLVELVNDLTKYFCLVIVIDDGSGSTYEKIFSILQKNKSVAVIKNNVNLGKGRALKNAFNYLLGLKREVGCITVDADGQHCLKDILNIAETMRKHENALVLGCRKFDKKVPLRSRFGNSLTRFVFRWLCGISVSDTQTGLRGIPYSWIARCCTIEGEKYEYETNMLLEAKTEGVELIENSIETIYEPGNPTSHFNPIRDSFSIYKFIFRYSLSSLAASLVDYLVFFFLTNHGSTVFIANYIGRGISAIVNYTINKRIVFHAEERNLKMLCKYLLLLVGSGTVSAILINGIAYISDFNILILKIFVEIILYFANFYIQSNMIFKRR